MTITRLLTITPVEVFWVQKGLFDGDPATGDDIDASVMEMQDDTGFADDTSPLFNEDENDDWPVGPEAHTRHFQQVFPCLARHLVVMVSGSCEWALNIIKITKYATLFEAAANVNTNADAVCAPVCAICQKICDRFISTRTKPLCFFVFFS